MSETNSAEPAAEATVTPPAGAPGNALADAAAPKTEGAEQQAQAEEVERVGAPEAYEFTPPEGQELNTEQFTEWQGIAREAGVTQKQFATLTTKAIGMVNAMHAQQAEAWHNMQREWQAGIAADTEIAGATPGTLNDAAKEAAARVFAAYGGDDLKQALIVTGAGNHPAIVKAFVAIGKAMAEEGNVAGAARTASPESPYAGFYKPMN